MLTILFSLLYPSLLIIFGKMRLVKTVSPVVMAYAGGIIFGNLPFEFSKNSFEELTHISVPVAICLLLLSTNIKESFKVARPSLLSFFLIVLSVFIISFSAYFIFNSHIGEAWKISGMLVGVFTGGTPNLTAIGQALEVKNNIFILMNAADLVMGATYLLFILSVGPRFFSYFLQTSQVESHNIHDDPTCNEQVKWFHFLINTVIALLVLGICSGLSKLLFGNINGSFIIFSLTTLSLILSTKKKLRNLPGAYLTGDYFLLVFCFSIGAMANVNELLNSSISYFLYFAYVMLGSLVLHTILCRIFSIDKDTAIVTSMAALFGPAFIAPITLRLNNNALLIPGIATGLLGYALGNYLGLTLAYLLNYFL